MKALGVEPKLPWNSGDSEEQEHWQVHNYERQYKRSMGTLELYE